MRKLRQSRIKKAIRFVLPAALALPLLSSVNESSAKINPESGLRRERLIKKAKKPQVCVLQPNELKGYLEKGEKIREIVCKRGSAFILTDKSLVVVSQGGGEMIAEDRTRITHLKSVSRVDLRHILPHGLVAWTQAPDDTCFFLTKDSVLTRRPVHEKDGAPVSYRLHRDVSEAKMMHFQGFLFIAPASGEMIVLSFSKGFRYDFIPLPKDIKNGEFSWSKGELYYAGTNGKKLRIEIGQDIDDIVLVRGLYPF